MLFLPDLPARRTPPRMGIGVPASDRPMRRLKNRSVCTCAEVNALPVPMVKKLEFSRKKSRFSGIEQAEAREVHLLLVHLHLREVGVERDVHVEPGRDAVARVEAHVANGVGGADVGDGCRSRTPPTKNGFSRRSSPRLMPDRPCSSPARLTCVSV